MAAKILRFQREIFSLSEKFQNVKILPEACDDFIDIIASSGRSDEYIRKLRMRVRYLSEKLERCVDHREWFERLKNHEAFYSMRMKGSLNVRIIFVFAWDEREHYAVLLNAFLEQGKDKYEDFIPICKHRIAQYEIDVRR